MEGFGHTRCTGPGCGRGGLCVSVRVHVYTCVFACVCFPEREGIPLDRPALSRYHDGHRPSPHPHPWFSLHPWVSWGPLLHGSETGHVGVGPVTCFRATWTPQPYVNVYPGSPKSVSRQEFPCRESGSRRVGSPRAERAGGCLRGTSSHVGRPVTTRTSLGFPRPPEKGQVVPLPTPGAESSSSSGRFS